MKNHPKTRCVYAFSLIELLIALIIISVITASFIPIMTKKLQKTDIALGQTGVITYSSKTFYEDDEWEIPKGVKKIKVTSIAGGGGGGGATYSFVEESKLEEMKGSPVLKRVTKYVDIPAVNNGVYNFLSPGTYNLSNVTPPENYKTPNLPSECKNVGIDKWTIVSTNTLVDEGVKIPSFKSDTNFQLHYASICGGGGGGAQAQTGGSNFSTGGGGGYIGNYALNLSANASTLTFKVAEAGKYTYVTNIYPAPGGAGGFGHNYGTNGGPGGANKATGNCGYSGGGGGGGSSAILDDAQQIILEAPGGGGAGGSAGDAGSSCGAHGGTGGTGGGINPGIGGSGSYCPGPMYCITGATSAKYVSSGAAIYAGGGGGGGGKGANLSKVFSGANCAPGTPGAIQIIYSVKGIKNGLKCDYGTIVANGAGGSSGQVVQEEITTTPGNKIKITVGKGGASNSQIILDKTLQGQKGNDGTDSYITMDEKILARAKGGLGGNAGSFTGHGTALSHDKTIKNYAKAQDGNNSHGGNGGSITQALCSLFDPIRGLGGCGGNIPSGTCANFALTPIGKAAAINGGGGGGGGSVSSSNAYQGGSGANGVVIIEYN